MTAAFVQHRLGMSPWRPAALLATWFGSGLLPWAPGSWGSLAALPFAWTLAAFLGPVGLALGAAALFPLGWWAADAVTRQNGTKDPGLIVVDEVVGQWLTLAAAPLDLRAYAVGFVLFRLFDIAKPWPASWADRELPGAFGVMADDALAAAYAAGILAIGRLILG